MTIRDHAPAGVPCWTDLWTSDVERSRAFYAELFGWEALPPNPEFGGYFMFTRDGVPVAGGMGPMGDMPADNRWKVYLATDDITKTLEVAEANGAQIVAPAGDVADLGRQAVLVDSAGATVGAWQAGTFPGFTVLNEHGAPSWFELHTRDHAGSVNFYRTVFGWETNVEGDTDEFRYTTLRDPEGEGVLAGIMDGARFMARRRADQLVRVLGGGRRGRGDGPGHGSRRLGRDGRPGHPLRAAGLLDRPDRGSVQPADLAALNPLGARRRRAVTAI